MKLRGLKNKESVKKRDGMLVDINIEHLLKILIMKINSMVNE